MACTGPLRTPIHEDVFIVEVIRRGIETVRLPGYENLVNPWAGNVMPDANTDCWLSSVSIVVGIGHRCHNS